MSKFGKTGQIVFLLVFIIFISGCQADGISSKLKSLDDKIGEGLKKIQRSQEKGTIDFLEGEKKIELLAEDLSREQKEKIEKWLEEKNLNRYGDLTETEYTGGTPLFDEATGASFDRYSYILKNHPELSDVLK
ncbi:MAG: hypothetical protein WC582_04585 [Patescibacteria group bacterium]